MDHTLVQVVESDEGYPANVTVAKGYGSCCVRAAASNLDYSEARWYRTVSSSVLKKVRVGVVIVCEVRRRIDTCLIQDPSMGKLSEPVHAIGLRLKSSLRQQGNIVSRVSVGKSDIENNRRRRGHAEG